MEEFKAFEEERKRTIASIEALKGVYFNLRNPKREALEKRIHDASKEHPEWLSASAWHDLIGSTPDPVRAKEFDLPSRPVSAFVQELADEFLG